MSQNDEQIKVLKGNKIPSVGFPLVVLTLEKWPSARRGIYYLLLAAGTKEVKLRKKAFAFKVPHSNDFILSQLEEFVKDELQNDISAARKEFGSDVVPPAVDFSFTEIPPDDFCFHIIKHGLGGQFQEIRERTECESLRKYLPASTTIGMWSVAEDTHTFRN